MKTSLLLSLLSMILMGCASYDRENYEEYLAHGAYVSVPIVERIDVSHPPFDLVKRPRRELLKGEKTRAQTPCEVRLNRHKLMVGQLISKASCPSHERRKIRRYQKPKTKFSLKKPVKHTCNQCPLKRQRTRNSYQVKRYESAEDAFLRKRMRYHYERAQRYRKRAKSVVTVTAYKQLWRMYLKEMRLAKSYFEAYKIN